MRLFLGIALSPETQAELERYVANLAGSGLLPGRASAPRNWHVTLVFLGEADEARRAGLQRQLDGADLGPPFAVEVAGPGGFPNAARAHIVWLGVGIHSEALARLQLKVSAASVAAGFTPEDRSFAPHMTLARAKPPVSVQALAASAKPPMVQLEVTRVVLFHSRSTPSGTEYDELASWPLTR